MRIGRKSLVFVVTLLAVLLLAASVAAAQPKRVLIVVMDQMHPGYAQKYGMRNVLWLENHGAYFPNAYVGDMASETVVSHNVMVSGLFPKHMGWSDEAMRDTTDVLGGGANGIYVSGDLSYAQFSQLIAAGDYPKLGTYLQNTFPGTVVACVGEKSYQVRSMLAGTSPGDVNAIGVFLGSRITPTLTDPFLFLGGKYRGPDGVNVPTYITNDPFGRFFVNSDSGNDYTTATTPPAWIYPEDGDRMVPGSIEGHLGGDTWVADAAIKIMQNENWSGLFVNLGGIDKIGHMWGTGEADSLTRYGWDPTSIYAQVHMPFIAKNADVQLGRMIGTLRARGELDDTLIVLTADHGSTYAKRFYGLNQLEGELINWEWGSSVNDGNLYLNDPPPPGIQKLVDTGNVAFSYQSTAIETWLTDFSLAKRQEAAVVMRGLKGVIATYYKSEDGNSYVLDKAMTARMTLSEYAWWKLHGQQLVNSMAWSGSADVVALLKNQTGYGAVGDHGGAQKDVQRIPMVFYNPSLAHADRTAPARLVDLMPTVLNTLGITPTKAMDGHAYTLALKP